MYGDIDRFVAGNRLCVGELVFGVDRVLFCLVIFILSIDRLDRRRRVWRWSRCFDCDFDDKLVCFPS